MCLVTVISIIFKGGEALEQLTQNVFVNVLIVKQATWPVYYLSGFILSTLCLYQDIQTNQE